MLCRPGGVGCTGGVSRAASSSPSTSMTLGLRLAAMSGPTNMYASSKFGGRTVYPDMEEVEMGPGCQGPQPQELPICEFEERAKAGSSLKHWCNRAQVCVQLACSMQHCSSMCSNELQQASMFARSQRGLER